MTTTKDPQPGETWIHVQTGLTVEILGRYNDEMVWVKRGRLYFSYHVKDFVRGHDLAPPPLPEPIEVTAWLNPDSGRWTASTNPDYMGEYGFIRYRAILTLVEQLP